MSVGKIEATGGESALESRTADYLRRHPEFFARHLELVAELAIPHACGDAVSLIEHQVDTLRGQNHQLRHRLQALIETARENEKLSMRLHQLTLELIDSRQVETVFSTLYESLRRDFNADDVVIRLFGEPINEGDRGLCEFTGTDPEAQTLFLTLFETGNPICGRIKRDQSFYLFGEHAGEIGSAVLLPMEVVRRFGVLAIGSHDPNRFHPGMSTVLLRQMAAVAGRIIQPFLAAP